MTSPAWCPATALLPCPRRAKAGATWRCGGPRWLRADAHRARTVGGARQRGGRGPQACDGPRQPVSPDAPARPRAAAERGGMTRLAGPAPASSLAAVLRVLTREAAHPMHLSSAPPTRMTAMRALVLVVLCALGPAVAAAQDTAIVIQPESGGGGGRPPGVPPPAAEGAGGPGHRPPPTRPAGRPPRARGGAGAAVGHGRLAVVADRRDRGHVQPRGRPAHRVRAAVRLEAAPEPAIARRRAGRVPHRGRLHRQAERPRLSAADRAALGRNPGLRRPI